MSNPKPRIRPIALLALLPLAIAGCTAEAPAPEATPTAAASESAAPSTGTPECDALGLADGASVDGQALGTCLAAVQTAAQSGRMTVSGGGISGVLSFRVGDDGVVDAEGSIDNGADSTEFVVLDGQAWMTFLDRWVRADATSSDPFAVLAQTTYDQYRLATDPLVTADVVASAGTWTAAADGEGWTLTTDAPFTWGQDPNASVDIAAMSFALGPDALPMRQSTTTSALGATAEVVVEFSGWGEPVEITAPAV